MKKVCLTYFEPFGERRENVSLIVSKDVDNPKVNLDKKGLRVSYDNIEKEIEEIISSNYDLVVLTGEAGGRKKVSLEKLAINLKSAKIPDNDGKICFNERIDNGNDAIFSNVDVISLNEKLKEEGYDLEVSLTAGAYICNLSYYYALKKVKEKNLKTKVIFVHYPVLEDTSSFHKIIERIIDLV